MGNGITLISSFIENLSAYGATNLYGAIHEGLHNIIKQNQHSTIILITDGDDTERQYTTDEIISSASYARQQNPQFSMYTMGVGNSYNRNFFESISKKIGFTHIDLNNIEELREFDQYISNIGKNRIVYEFVDAMKTILEQVPSGELVIGNTISSNAEVIQGDNKYTIGVLDRAINGVNKFVDSLINCAVNYSVYVTKDSCYFPNINCPYINDWSHNNGFHHVPDLPMIGADAVMTGALDGMGANMCYANQSIFDGM